jgi:hypothetical protein
VLEREYVGVINDTDFTCSGSFSAGADGSRNHVMWRIHCFMQFLTDSKSSACSFIHKNILLEHKDHYRVMERSSSCHS